MPFRLALSIAIRHLRSRRRQTLLAVLGIVVGGSIFALMVAITVGQKAFLQEKLVDVSPHITVTSDRADPIVPHNLLGDSGLVVQIVAHAPPTARREVKHYQELMRRTERSTASVAAVAPFVLLQGVLRSGTRYQTVTMRGIDPAREISIARLSENMQWGRLADLESDPNGVIIGRGLARKLKVLPGDDVRLVTPGGDIQTLHVVGVFESGVSEFDDRRGYIGLKLAQSLRRMSRDAVTGLSVQVRNLNEIEATRRSVVAATGYQAETWEESNAQVIEFQARQMSTSRLLVVFVFITAAFGISNTLIAIVLQKKQDIAVMKSFGVSRRGVVMIFLMEGVIIGLIGGALAALVGYGLSNIFASLNLFPQNNDRAFLRFDRFPVSLDYEVYALTFVLSLLMAAVASFFPARRAAGFVPVRIIRGE